MLCPSLKGLPSRTKKLFLFCENKIPRLSFKNVGQEWLLKLLLNNKGFSPPLSPMEGQVSWRQHMSSLAESREEAGSPILLVPFTFFWKSEWMLSESKHAATKSPSLSPVCNNVTTTVVGKGPLITKSLDFLLERMNFLQSYSCMCSVRSWDRH